MPLVTEQLPIYCSNPTLMTLKQLYQPSHQTMPFTTPNDPGHGDEGSRSQPLVAGERPGSLTLQPAPTEVSQDDRPGLGSQREASPDKLH